MESVEPQSHSHSQWCDSHISPENTKWLAENLEDFEQVIIEISKLIECGECSHAQSGDICLHKAPNLLTHIEEASRLHQFLARRYEHLISEVQKNCLSLPHKQHLDISDSSSPKASPFLTPDQKMGVHKSEESVGFDLFMSCGRGSSDISLREGSDSSLSLSSDSDSESLNSVNRNLFSPSKNEDFLKVRKTEGYEVFLKRINEYEEQLLILNKKLKSSEEEISSLKDGLKKNESVTLLVSNLQAQLESVQSDFEIQNYNLEMEREKVLKLHNQVVELETQICDADSKIERLTDELDVSVEKLFVSEDEITRLKHELSTQISEGTPQLRAQLEGAQRDVSLLLKELDSEKSLVLEMQEKILRYKTDLSTRDHQISELDAALFDAIEKFSVEKTYLHADISRLSEQAAVLKASVGSLENEIEQHKAENLKMKSLHEADIERLKAELKQKDESMGDWNKAFDQFKLKYDTLMTEKDGMNAQVDTLRAEASCRDNLIIEMEDQLCVLEFEHKGLIAGTANALKLIDELKLRLEEVEKEVEMQKNVISERAEEKREAIRQLCFSLEHYRTGYKELRQVCVGLKRHAVHA